MNQLRVCLVGAGRVGELYCELYKEYIPDAKIEAIVDLEISKAKELARKFGISENNVFDSFEKSINEVKFDAVIIVSPTFTHSDLTVSAADYGTHVFCEKPMAVNLNECDRMIAACEKAGVILQIGFMRRFDPGFAEAKKRMDEGIIGDPIIVKSLGRGPGLPPKWTYDISLSNGMLAEVNSHDFDTIRWLGNGEYKRVYAEAQNFKTLDIKKDFPGFYDSAVVSIRLTNNVMGIIDGVCPSEYGYDARAEVVGTKGIIMIGNVSEFSFVSCTRDSGLVSPQILSWRTRFHEAYISEHKHFIKCIKNGVKPDVTGMDGKMVTAAVIAANKSIIQGIPISL